MWGGREGQRKRRCRRGEDEQRRGEKEERRRRKGEGEREERNAFDVICWQKPLIASKLTIPSLPNFLELEFEHQ